MIKIALTFFDEETGKTEIHHSARILKKHVKRVKDAYTQDLLYLNDALEEYEDEDLLASGIDENKLTDEERTSLAMLAYCESLSDENGICSVCSEPCLTLSTNVIEILNLSPVKQDEKTICTDCFRTYQAVKDVMELDKKKKKEKIVQKVHLKQI